MSERRISVNITGPEGMLEAMAKVLREEGYIVVAPHQRAKPLAAERALIAAMGAIGLPYVVAAARNNVGSMWHAPAVAELVRRGAFDELDEVRGSWARKTATRRAKKKRARR